MASRTDRNARVIMGQHIDRAIAKGEVRPHEREKAIDIACDNWTGQTGNGVAAEHAINAIKRGV